MNKNIMKVLGASLIVGLLVTGCEKQQESTIVESSSDKILCTLTQKERDDFVKEVYNVLEKKGEIVLYKDTYNVKKDIYNEEGQKVTVKIPCEYRYSTNMVKPDVVFDCRASEPTLFIETHRPAFGLKVNIEKTTLDGKLLKDANSELYSEVKELLSKSNRTNTFEYCEEQIEKGIDFNIQNNVYNKEMKVYRDIITDIDRDIYDKTPVEIFEIDIP